MYSNNHTDFFLINTNICAHVLTKLRHWCRLAKSYYISSDFIILTKQTAQKLNKCGVLTSHPGIKCSEKREVLVKFQNSLEDLLWVNRSVKAWQERFSTRVDFLRYSVCTFTQISRQTPRLTILSNKSAVFWQLTLVCPGYRCRKFAPPSLLL